jgi:hypothetical protein
MPSLSSFVTSSAESILNYNIDCRWGMSRDRSKHRGSDAERINQQCGQSTPKRWLIAGEGCSALGDRPDYLLSGRTDPAETLLNALRIVVLPRGKIER